MSLTYKDAGVDIAAGEALVRAIAPLARSTHRPEVIGELGGFSGLFRLAPRQLDEPLLVAATDGVGTKLKVALAADRHDTVGIDLVAMCVNDLVVCGAEPLFFLDYFATGALDVERGRAVVAGIAEGCRQAGCALLGGETAEMPGFYAAGEYDLAGFAVGLVERRALLSPERVRSGDVLLGLAASGLHSNGYSLVRRALLADGRRPPADELDELLRPTRIYVRACRALLAGVELHALAHITGGGLPGNLPRALPAGLAVEVQAGSWPVPPVFERVRRAGDVKPAEMLATFNMGIGMVAIVPPADAAAARSILDQQELESWPIGRVVEGDDDRPAFRLLPAG
jgi:phosphoribosylformylglycinamidine cyclo-ligase